MKNLIFLLLLISLVLLPLHVFAAAPARTVETVTVGSWNPIKDVKDPNIVAIAKFAVSEYNKQSRSGLTFVTVLSGEYQILSGVNYRLLLTASDHNYMATVYENPWFKSMKLISFNPFTH